jgi:diguanylate cyclase (GGDEF)-like protein
MVKKLKNRVRRGGAVAGAVLLASAIAPVLSLQWVADTRLERDRVQAQIDALREVQALLVDAETGQRGFVITGRDEFLQPYRAATRELPATLAELHREYAEEPEVERRLLAELEDDAHQKLAELAETVALRKSQGFQAVEPIVTAGQGKRFMDQVRACAGQLVARETSELAALERDLARKIRWTIALSALSTLFSIAVFVVLGRNLWQAILHREQLGMQAAEANRRLEEGMRAVEAHSVEVAALSEMARVLQAEMTLREALGVTAQFCARLLPGTRGAIHLFRNSADLLERAAAWGDGELAAPTMEPKSCWGLRLGRPHSSRDVHGLRCTHHRDADTSVQRLCIPLMAYGEVLGMLELAVAAQAPALADGMSAVAQTIAEQAALALSNAKLRQVLRDQSIKDPLTGLFNRRYMEETLARELARAERQKRPLSLIVADIDHFKRINDTHGHPTGDAVLRTAGNHLGGAVRESDVACRYGGEEFVLILPDCARESAVAKANELRERLRLLAFPDGGAGVQITASFGVASFPLDGIESQGLLQAADAALYAAKKGGRNRVVAAGEAAPPVDDATTVRTDARPQATPAASAT